jgi:hypothetical protein
MLNKERHSSDSSSVSSNTTDNTSRATTPQTSWSATTLQKKMNRLNQFKIQPIEADQSSIHSTTSEQVATVSIKSPDGMNTQNQQQQEWVNPYWGPKSNSGTIVTQSETNPIVNNNTNIEK